MLIDTHKSPYAKAWSLPSGSMRWTEGFWKTAADVCADETVPHVLGLFESDEGFHAVANFKIAAGLMEGSYKGPPFDDGDFYKILEGAMVVAHQHQDNDLMARIDAHIDLIGQAIQPDGYLSTKQIIGERQNNGVHRQGDIND
ncbi:MAG: glycoside hydrolase family 127 protein, partial [Bacillota bacterium]|nr:glycoside hydrolase family 127 protein [Bacillota bacterium]